MKLTIALQALLLASSRRQWLVLVDAGRPVGVTDDGGEANLFPPVTAPVDDNRYIVNFDTEEGHSAIQNVADKVYLELGRQKAVAVQITNPQALAALANKPGVTFIEQDPPRYPMGGVRGGRMSLKTFAKAILKQGSTEGDVERNQKTTRRRRLAQTVPYGIEMVQADQVSYAGNRKVCIIDSGYNLGHEDLPTSGVHGDDDLDGAGPWDEDGFGHGTHVAGTIAAIGDNDKGVIGVAPGVSLHIIRVFGDDGYWAYSYASELIHALQQCTDAGANIVSMSLGCSGSPLCASSSEQAAFDNAYNNLGVLSIAAAGNDGNTQMSYPASYDSVVSVAALDFSKTIASFSQQNSQVELAAPGVGVRSTVPMSTGYEESFAVTDGPSYSARALQNCGQGTVTGTLVDCGLGTSPCSEGAVCLILRGDNTFAEKVQNCENGGGVAAVIYNNVAGNFAGTLGEYYSTIPAVSISDTDGQDAKNNQLGNAATVTVGEGNYASWSGTSMATPHVSGVAALVWSQDTGCLAGQIRKALQQSAQDLGSLGKDNAYGYGLVQAKDASVWLGNDCGVSQTTTTTTTEPPCAPVGYSCTNDDDCCENKCRGPPSGKTCR